MILLRSSARGTNCGPSVTRDQNYRFFGKASYGLQGVYVDAGVLPTTERDPEWSMASGVF